MHTIHISNQFNHIVRNWTSLGSSLANNIFPPINFSVGYVTATHIWPSHKRQSPKPLTLVTTNLASWQFSLDNPSATMQWWQSWRHDNFLCTESVYGDTIAWGIYPHNCPSVWRLFGQWALSSGAFYQHGSNESRAWTSNHTQWSFCVCAQPMRDDVTL